MGYGGSKTVVYNDTIVKLLNQSKYCSSGSYTNPDAYTMNTDMPSDGSDETMA